MIIIEKHLGFYGTIAEISQLHLMIKTVIDFNEILLLLICLKQKEK